MESNPFSSDVSGCESFLVLFFFFSSVTNYEGMEFGKIISQAGRINSDNGTIMKKEKGIYLSIFILNSAFQRKFL